MMKEQIGAYKAEFEAFWERLIALPAEISAAYDVCSVLSEGNGKTTCLIAAKDNGRRYILKTSDLQCKESLEEEYSLLETLSGSSFPRAISFAQNDSCRYLVRQYVEGVTLDQYVAQHGVFSESESARIAYELCRALETLHSLRPPVIHRDIKPQNVIYTPERTCVLIDMGAARRYDTEAVKDTTTIGSEITAAPEQYGYRQTDVRSDVYALGVLMLYLCTGSYDLDRCNDIQNKRLSAIIRRCTRFDPDDRYSSIRLVQLHLSRVLVNRPRWYASFPAGVALGLAMGSVLCFFAMRAILPQQTDEVKTVALAAAAAEATETPNLQPVSFSSGLIERAVRETLGMEETTPIYESDLERVTQLLILGDKVYTDWNTYISDVNYTMPEGNGTLFAFDDASKFPNLTVLGITDQKLYDLSFLKDTIIERLCLCDNLIIDLAPLTEMPCLSELYLNGNPLSDITQLGNVPTIKVLDIGNTKVTDLLPLAGGRMQSLTLFDAPITDYSPLLEMPQLETLKVNRLDETGIAVCSELTQLGSLAIDHTPVLTNLAPLSGLTNLYFLDLVYDGLQDISGIERLTKLDYLCLIGNPLSDFSPLTKLTNLRAVNITWLELDDYSFLTKIPGLVTVYCDAEQQKIIRDLPGAENLGFILS